MRKKEQKTIRADGKPIVIESQDPVAKVLWQKTFHMQVKSSRKMYDRKKQKRTARKIIGES